MFLSSKIKLVGQYIIVKGFKKPIPINEVQEISITSKRKIKFLLLKVTILTYKLTLTTRENKIFNFYFHKNDFNRIMKLKNQIKTLANATN